MILSLASHEVVRRAVRLARAGAVAAWLVRLGCLSVVVLLGRRLRLLLLRRLLVPLLLLRCLLLLLLLLRRLLVLLLRLVVLSLVLLSLMLMRRAAVAVNATSLIRALGLGRVPLQVVLAHNILHGVATNVLTIKAALTNARAIAEVVALILRQASVVRVIVTSHDVDDKKTLLQHEWKIKTNNNHGMQGNALAHAPTC